LEEKDRREEIGEPDEAFPRGSGEERQPDDRGHLILLAGADRLADEDRSGTGDAEGRHERHGVDLDDRHQSGERSRAEPRYHDVDEEAEGEELEEPVEARRQTVAERAAELGETERRNDPAGRAAVEEKARE